MVNLLEMTLRCAGSIPCAARRSRVAMGGPGASGADCESFEVGGCGGEGGRVKVAERADDLSGAAAEGRWWAQQDSNLRLPPCEGGTLPLSYAPLAGGGEKRGGCRDPRSSPGLCSLVRITLRGGGANRQGCGPGIVWASYGHRPGSVRAADGREIASKNKILKGTITG